MNFEELPGTCSMIELQGVNPLKVIQTTKEEFYGKIFDYGWDFDDNRFNIGSIIYNTISKDVKFFKQLQSFGFKKIGEYKGNDGDVTSWLLVLKPTIKKAILKLQKDEFINDGCFRDEAEENLRDNYKGNDLWWEPSKAAIKREATRLFNKLLKEIE